MVQVLLQCPGIHINQPDHDGQTALIIAATRGHLELAAVLIEHPDIDLNAQTKVSSSLCHAAIGAGSLVDIWLRRLEGQH